jgi:hypothetical protein
MTVDFLQQQREVLASMSALEARIGQYPAS